MRFRCVKRRKEDAVSREIELLVGEARQQIQASQTGGFPLPIPLKEGLFHRLVWWILDPCHN